jgi:hypothetical protein
MTTAKTARTARTPVLAVWIPPLLDLLVVTVFVLIGRRSHDEGESVAGFLRVWWPFAAGLGVSSLGAGSWWHPFVWKRVAVAWIGTVVLGMVLRIGIEGRQFKPAFVIVTIVFLGAGMFGWRAIARRITR